ncbi:MAG: Crp/Fnr family transcriptional regulator [Planctomycetota bacterium]|jgi:CRP/FNR family transcriptional regulator
MSKHTADLARCPLFASVVPDDLARIAQASRVVNVRAGGTVFREGQLCEAFYIVAKGKVRVYKIGPDGRERTLHVVHPPYAFAEAAMFGPRFFPAFAAAIEDSRLIRVQREPFLRLLRERPESALRVFESLSGWMHRLLDQLENETFLNARAKLTNYLLRQARQQSADGAPGCVRLTESKKDIASQLGMAPETFSRALADLEARNLIRPSGRQVDLVDAEALESLLLGDDPNG